RLFCRSGETPLPMRNCKMQNAKCKLAVENPTPGRGAFLFGGMDSRSVNWQLAFCILQFAMVFLLAWPSAALAALDPAGSTPYQLKVVLSMPDSPLFKSLYKDQVERELRESLQAGLGELATVEVVREHPRLKEVRDNGLQVLDSWKDVTNDKTHFVLIDFVNGQYDIQARQHDGLTGQASAVLRHETTPDRQFVARTAALLVGQDFGITGTLTDKGDGKTVRIVLKGHELGMPLDRWVKPGDLFSLVRISQASGGLKGAPEEWAVLQVQKGPENNGVCECRLYHRHEKPLEEGPGVLGFRCGKMNTIKAPLRIRLVRAKTQRLTPLPGFQVHVRRAGFTGEDNSKLQGSTDAYGYYTTADQKEKGLFENLAFVSVMQGSTTVAQIPVPITEDRTVVIPLLVGGDAGLQLVIRRDLWVQQVTEDLLLQVDLFKEVAEMVDKGKQREKALQRAMTGLKSLQDDIARFAREGDNLAQEDKTRQLRLEAGKEGIERLRKTEKNLQAMVTRLEQIVKQEND